MWKADETSGVRSGIGERIWESSEGDDPEKAAFRCERITSSMAPFSRPSPGLVGALSIKSS